MFHLIRQQKNSEFSLRFILQKENDLWKNFSTMLKLVKKGTRKEASYDYGEYVLGEKLLNIQGGLEAISNLYAKNGEKGKLVIPDYDEIQSEQEAVINELNNIRNIMYVFIATTVILIATTVYLAIRKPKIIVVRKPRTEP